MPEMCILVMREVTSKSCTSKLYRSGGRLRKKDNMSPVKSPLCCLLTLGLVCFTIGNRFIMSSSVNVGCFLLSKSYSRNKIWTPSGEQKQKYSDLAYYFELKCTSIIIKLHFGVTDLPSQVIFSWPTPPSIPPTLNLPAN